MPATRRPGRDLVHERLDGTPATQAAASDEGVLDVQRQIVVSALDRGHATLGEPARRQRRRNGRLDQQQHLGAALGRRERRGQARDARADDDEIRSGLDGAPVLMRAAVRSPGRPGDGWVEDGARTRPVQLRGSPALARGSGRGMARRGHEPCGTKHLAAQVREVQVGAPDGFVHRLKVAEREQAGQEGGREGRVFELCSCPFESGRKDLRVVECERSVDARGTRLDGHPRRSARPPTRDGLRQVRREHQVADGDDPHSWVAIRRPERGKLFQVVAPKVHHASLLRKHACGEVLQRLP